MSPRFTSLTPVLGEFWSGSHLNGLEACHFEFRSTRGTVDKLTKEWFLEEFDIATARITSWICHVCLALSFWRT